jgi:hypothetical protein
MNNMGDTEVGKTELLSALDEIVEGRSVSRKVVDLSEEGSDHEGADLVRLFVDRLRLHGFVEKRVGEIELEFEERVPAFVIRDRKAYFGWVFIERFTETKSRKLFGSVVRNSKGDWLIQISHKSHESIFANSQFKSGMEGERLFVME